KTNADIVGKKGLALFLLGKYRDALDTYDRAVSLNPNVYQNLEGKADVLAALNRYSEADAMYDAALKIEPRSNATWNKKGVILARMFKNEEAAEAFNQSVIIYPGSAEVWNNMGSALFNQGKMKEALKAFEQAIALDDSYIPQKYGDTLSRLQQDKQAAAQETQENGSGPAVITPELKLPPPIFLINYLMVGVGILAILTLGIILVFKRRKQNREIR
ncbi:MAG: tetratricopeptide repeat protein, partial [Methanospirillum sp.]|uniref:tetratricopeptide repeat protein n=1 Tax=Methanospirillum sp. TaxID=45200 RepID=UPI002375D062